jgi:hypothetical protein
MALSLEEVLSLWAKDSIIDKSRLDEISVDSARLHAKWLQILAAVRRNLFKAKEARDALSHEKNLWMTGKMTKEEIEERGWAYDPFNGHSKPLKSEMGEYVKVDPEIQALRDRVNELEVIHDTVVEIVDSIKWRHQSVRNAISFMQFTSGN